MEGERDQEGEGEREGGRDNRARVLSTSPRREGGRGEGSHGPEGSYQWF